jgi:hypothetical protein
MRAASWRIGAGLAAAFAATLAQAAPLARPVLGPQMSCAVAIDAHGKRTITIGGPHGGPIAAGTLIDWLLSNDPKMAPPGLPLSKVRPHALAGRGQLTLSRKLEAGQTAVAQVPAGPAGSCAAFEDLSHKRKT